MVGINHFGKGIWCEGYLSDILISALSFFILLWLLMMLKLVLLSYGLLQFWITYNDFCPSSDGYEG